MEKIYKHLVIGGGIIGASLANKLAETASIAGEKTSVCLLEQHGIASGMTSKSAGIIIKDHKTDIATELASRTLRDLNKFSKSNEVLLKTVPATSQGYSSGPTNLYNISDQSFG